MSAFAARLRQLHSLPAARRSYSSFFSKPGGGGRYFDSRKATKPVVAVAKDAATTSLPDAAADAPSQTTATSNAAASNPLKPDDAPSTSVASPPRVSTLVPLALAPSSHPIVEPTDLQLHQFFSLHRPMLLLADPPAILHSAPPGAPLFPRAQWRWDAPLPDAAGEAPMMGMRPPVDPDADTARQLTRALTMARAGATISWANTLRHLGVEVVEAGAQDPQADEWEDILADSTKRKRRKKMKKHKLRKRRKLTRASRLKLR